jgi:shikimate dehydrogenase
MPHYVVLGNPISHSLSPQLQSMFAAQFGMTIDYQKQSVPLDAFTQTVDRLRRHDLAGANITIPFKINAFDYADQLTDRARLAQAVNTFIFKNNKCIGDNTDGIGCVRDLKNNHVTLANKNILVIGAGGAARGILGEIIREKPQHIYIYNRTIKNAEQLIHDFEKHFLITHHQAEPIDVIINTTNAHFQTDIDLTIHASNAICYDLNYSERHHTFLTWAQKNNAAHIIDGLGMLVEQGAESFFQWFEKKPSTLSVIEELRAITN